MAVRVRNLARVMSVSGAVLLGLGMLSALAAPASSASSAKVLLVGTYNGKSGLAFPLLGLEYFPKLSSTSNLLE